MNNQKNIAFEYIVDKLINWYNEKSSPLDYTQSLTRLKLMKLLFFICAVNTNEDSDENSLLKLFNNFYAMPFGPVESDILNSICDDSLSKYKIENRVLNIKFDNSINLSIPSQSLIDSSIEKLREINDDLITYTAFELVDLTHKWSCWQISYEYGQSKGKNSMIMPSFLINRSTRYYIK